MLAGTAWEDITPVEPLDLLGQLHIRKGLYTRDPLTVNAAAFRQDEQTLVLVSVDVCMLPDVLVRQMRVTLEGTHGLEPGSVLIGATHTHVAPCTWTEVIGQPSRAFITNLRAAVYRCVDHALNDLEEVRLYASSGNVDQMGWNRRGFHPDGRVDMYYGSWNADFAGLEGPRDGYVPVILARRLNGQPKLVVTGFATHPNCLEGESFYSADLPGEVRRVLRQQLDTRLGVVYFTGAAADTAPSIMEHNPQNLQPWRGEEGLRRSGSYLGAEILKVIATCIEPTLPAMNDAVLRVAHRVLDIPVRPYPRDFKPENLGWSGARDYFTRERAHWDRTSREHRGVNVTVARLGDAVICTNPGELYCALGLAIRQGSPAGVTLTAELTDGYAGYIPTRGAFAHGGYSTWPAATCKLAEDAGDRIVAATHEMLREVFGGAPSHAIDAQEQGLAAQEI